MRVNQSCLRSHFRTRRLCNGSTDSTMAPIHAHANAAFVLQQMELSTIDLMPILISFMNTLVVGMMSHDTEYYNEQRQKFDDFQNSFLADRWS